MNQLALFDYDQLDLDTRASLKQRAERINERSRKMAGDIWEIGREFAEAQKELAQHRYGCFQEWARSETGYSKSTVYNFINVYKNFNCPTVGQLDFAPKVLYALSASSTPDEARQEAIERATNGEVITHQKAKEIIVSCQAEPDTQEAELELQSIFNPEVMSEDSSFNQPFRVQEVEFNPEKTKSYITLEKWNQGERWGGLHKSTQMNLVNENIEWAAFSWNPITGCLHNCAYCYARDIANRFYAQKFEPSFIPERLSQPANTKSIKPRWEGDKFNNNVFTCSMADLFGKWVPKEWIDSVLEQIENNPQWTFLLLTKFPIRMAEFSYPDNVWLGTTVDYQWTVERAEKAFTKIKASGFNGICWLSCEPMMEQLTFNSLDMFDWVVMGGSSRSSQTPEFRPPFEWIVHLHNQARNSGCKIYQKTNLIPGMGDEQRIREYPV